MLIREIEAIRRRPKNLQDSAGARLLRGGNDCMILRACAVIHELLGRGIHAAGSESDFDSGQMKITL